MQTVLDTSAVALSCAHPAASHRSVTGAPSEGHHLIDVLQRIAGLAHIYQAQQAPPLVVLKELFNQLLLSALLNYGAVTDTHT